MRDMRSTPKRQRSELPVVRLATGQPLPTLNNAQIEALFAAEDQTETPPHSARHGGRERVEEGRGPT